MVFRLSQVRLLTVSLIFHSNQGKRQNFFSRGDYRKNTVPVSMIKKAGSYSHYRPGKKNAHNQVKRDKIFFERGLSEEYRSSEHDKKGW